MAHNKPKKIKNMSIKTINGRVKKMLKIRDKYIKDIDNAHVRLQKGNSKTGVSCWTVSMIPIADCDEKYCKKCSKECYDIINVCFQPAVQNDRARNSAIHKVDPERYWNEISMGIQLNCVTELRLNVGGDLKGDDFYYVNEVAKKNPKCDILFFTKSYDDINMFLDGNEFEPNVHAIMSAWENTPMNNKHNLPVSHVLYEDGRTTAPQYGSTYCGGNCSNCHYNTEERGCWELGKGQSVIFPAH